MPLGKDLSGAGTIGVFSSTPLNGVQLLVPQTRPHSDSGVKHVVIF